MSPQQEASPCRPSSSYANESKRMRTAGGRQPGFSTTTRASSGTPTSMTNKGSVYKAQRGKVTAAAVKAKAPATHRRRGRKGKSVYRGVCVTREGKWRAVIYKERKQLYLGVYESEVDAAKAHDRAARFHFAENAVCNFESEDEADKQLLLQKEQELMKQQQREDEVHAEVLVGGEVEEGGGGGEVEDEDALEDGDWYERCYDMYSTSSTDSITDSPVHDGTSSVESHLGSEDSCDSKDLPSVQQEVQLSPLSEFGFPFPEELLGYDVHAWQNLSHGPMSFAGAGVEFQTPFGDQNLNQDPNEAAPPPNCHAGSAGMDSMAGELGLFSSGGFLPYMADLAESH